MKNPNFGRGQRNLLGAGKGDKSRVENVKAYDKNFDRIDFGRGPGVPPERRNGKTTKRYGNASVKPFRTGPHISIGKPA